MVMKTNASSLYAMIDAYLCMEPGKHRRYRAYGSVGRIRRDGQKSFTQMTSIKWEGGAGKVRYSSSLASSR